MKKNQLNGREIQKPKWQCEEAKVMLYILCTQRNGMPASTARHSRRTRTYRASEWARVIYVLGDGRDKNEFCFIKSFTMRH